MLSLLSGSQPRYPMNPIRGLVRLWMAASIGWIAAIALVEQPDHSLEIYLRSGSTVAELDDQLSESEADPISIPWSGSLVSRERVEADVVSLRKVRREIRGDLVAIAALTFFPPLALLALSWLATVLIGWFRNDLS